jgi:elongation factor G
MAALVFKIVADPHSDLYFLRVYSGVLRAGSRVLNVGRRKKENLPKLFRVFAKRREQIAEAHCGDIVAAIGLKDTLTGDTITDTHGGILLERIEFPETVISLAIEPQSSADRDKLLAALQMLARSDPTFRFRADLETGQTIISGMGELHLETRCNYLKRELGVPVRVGKPRVAYRETIATVGEGEGQLIRQPSQGKGQFAIVRLRVEPFVPSAGQENVQFLSALPDKIIRPEYVAAIEHGVRSSASTGVLGGYPMINVRITLFGAQEHTTDSSDAAFEGAAGIAFRRACEHASPALLEPIMKVEVVTPEEYFGPINSDLMARRAMIVDTGMRAKNHVIHAEAPLSTMFGYATQVRSLSQGRASYSMEPCRYEKMPPELVRQVLGAI